MNGKHNIRAAMVGLFVLAALMFLHCKCKQSVIGMQKVERHLADGLVQDSSSRDWGLDHAKDEISARCVLNGVDVPESRMPLSAVVEKSQMAVGVVSQDVRASLSSQLDEKSATARARAASDKNQLMDALLNQPEIPSDYGETMVSLCRDKSQDVLTRDFAVQHIGLYAQALSRRGAYNPKSAEAMSLRDALFAAAGETRTVVAAAAFRALADMAAFNPQIDIRRLDSMLAGCADDHSAAPAARAMAVQLCGERRVRSARPALQRILASPNLPEILRRSAKRAVESIDGKAPMQ